MSLLFSIYAIDLGAAKADLSVLRAYMVLQLIPPSERIPSTDTRALARMIATPVRRLLRGVDGVVVSLELRWSTKRFASAT